MSPIRTYRSLDRGTRRIIQLGAFALAAVAIAGALALFVAFGANGKGDSANDAARVAASAAAKAQEAADIAAAFAQADCSTWYDLAILVPSSQATNFQIYVDFRKSYAGKGCVAITGGLPPADPRVKPLLPPGVN